MLSLLTKPIKTLINAFNSPVEHPPIEDKPLEEANRYHVEPRGEYYVVMDGPRATHFKFEGPMAKVKAQNTAKLLNTNERIRQRHAVTA